MKFLSFLTAALAAAGLAACQPAPAPDAAETTTTRAEAPTNTGGAGTAVAQPAGEALAAETAFPANCPLLATRNWEARSRPHETYPLTWIDIIGEVDLPATYYPSAQIIIAPVQGTEARFVLRFGGVSPTRYSQVTQTVPVQSSDLFPQGVTRASIGCGDGVIATIPIMPAAP